MDFSDFFNQVQSSGAKGFVSGIFNALSAAQQQRYAKQNMAAAQQYALAQQQNASDLQMSNWSQMFDAQNARQDQLFANQKSMEMQGLKNAGLNPALAAGDGAIAGVSSPSASTPAGSSSPLGVIPPSTAYSADVGALGQYKTAESQIDLNKAQSVNLDALTQKTQMQAFWEMENLRKQGKLLTAQENESVERAQNLIVERAKTVAEEETIRQQGEKYKAESSYLTTQNQAAMAQLPYVAQEAAARIGVLASEMAKNDAQRDQFYALGNYYVEQTALVSKQIETEVENKRLTKNQAAVAYELWKQGCAGATIQQLEADARSKLGPNYQAVMTVIKDNMSIISDISQTAMSIGIAGRAFGVFGKAKPIMGFKP